MLPRLEEIETDLLARRARAEAKGWLGEIEGIDLTLAFLRDKLAQTERTRARSTVLLDMAAALKPGVRREDQP